MAPRVSSDTVELDDIREDWSPNSKRTQVLAVLATVFVANQACRALPFYLVDFSPDADPAQAMNIALGFGSVEYGLLATFVFTVPFMLASLAAGALADGMDRMRLSALAGLAWSACTVAMAVADSFSSVIFSRALLGVSQAATNPASLSLVADLFPRERATANAIFGLGIYVGGGVASLGAGLDGELGWRSSCVVFGACSAAASMLALLISDPRCLQGSSQTTSGVAANAEVGAATAGPVGILGRAAEATERDAARWIFVASALRFCAGNAILVWLPPVIRVQFPDNVQEFAGYNALIKAFAGGASSLAGGVIADALRLRGLGDSGAAAFCAASSLLAVPLWIAVLSEGSSFQTCMFFLLIEYLVAESWLGPALAALQGAVPPERRGSAQGVFSSLTALGGAVPALLGLVAPAEQAPWLQGSVAVCYVLSSLGFVAAAITLRKDVDAQTNDDDEGESVPLRD